MKLLTVRQVQRYAAHGIDSIPDAAAQQLFPSWHAEYGRCATYVRHGVVGDRRVELAIVIDRHGCVTWRTTMSEAPPARVQKRTVRQLADSCAARYGADESWHHAVVRLLDDIIDFCDDHAQSRAVERPKDVDVVDGSRQDGDVTHGGDGASGETTAPAASPAPRPDGAPDAAERADDPLESADRLLEELARRADERRRRGDRRGSGGRGWSDSGVRLATSRRTVVEECRKALSLLLDHEADDVDGPRWSATHLARRLVTRQSLAPARRREMGRPSILVIADVSGSCAPFAEPACATANACGACGVPGADVLVLSIINPFVPIELRVNGKDFPLPGDIAGQSASVDGVVAFFARHGWRTSTVIHLGDEQECRTVEAWALRPDINRVVWLDNYLSSQERPGFKRKRTRSLFPNAAVREKVCHVIGCGNARAMAVGLALAIHRRP